MPRKTNGSTTTTRSKKTVGSVPPAEVQVAPVIGKEISKEAPKNGKPANVVPINLNLNLEDQIRRRAYELYLQRRATGGPESGSENQDWLMAEREIRSRLAGQEQTFGAAAGQARH
ncbi:MAG TPA: DUF2934 domain-containing protein [Terriglobales bacterium]|nr:DUF2934 domain-containing protein [Terriglobales bacterium]